MRLDDVKGFVLDVDGTLVHRAGDGGARPARAREVLARIRASGRPLAIFTNGSHLAPGGFAAGLRARRPRRRRRGDAHAAPQRAVVPARAAPGGPVLLFGTGSRARVPRCWRRDRARRGRRRRRRRVRRARRPGGLHELERAARAIARRRAASHRQLLRLPTPERTGRSSAAVRWSRPRSRRRGRAAGHRRQAVTRRATDDQRAARRARRTSWS